MDEKLREIAGRIPNINDVVTKLQGFDDVVNDMCAYVREVKAENRQFKIELRDAYKLIIELRLDLMSKNKSS